MCWFRFLVTIDRPPMLVHVKKSGRSSGFTYVCGSGETTCRARQKKKRGTKKKNGGQKSNQRGATGFFRV